MTLIKNIILTSNPPIEFIFIRVNQRQSSIFEIEPAAKLMALMASDWRSGMKDGAQEMYT